MTTMSDSVTFTVDGNPVPLARPVLSRTGKASGRVWLHDPNKEKKLAFRNTVRQKLFGEGEERILFPLHSPIAIDIVFLIPAPKNHFVGVDRDRGELKKSSVGLWPSKPDIDNLDKFVLDALQGLLFVNDGQVVEQHIWKAYDHSPPFQGRTKVTIRRANTINW
jgi:Holliday junction resolvase RusA-like endonuclease